MPKLELPNDIEIIYELGSGRRSQVYLAKYLGKDAAVKVYKTEYVQKYQNRYKVNIGEFEFQRNKIAAQVSAISEYIAQPYRLLQPKDGYTLAFVQEYVDGIWLEDVIEKTKGLPQELLEVGYFIVREAAKVGLYDLDIPPGNIRVKQNSQGKWYLKLYDFNLMPQYLHPPNPFMALGFMLGLRSKNHRDYRSLRQWNLLGKQAEKQ